MIRGLRFVAMVAGAAALGSAAANAAPCTNPNAMGVSRVITVDARAMPLIGSHDYGFTLPLAPGEIVLTFDDGPLAPYTNRVLKALADECVQAIFFMVGRQATANPQLAMQVRDAGHTIGTHTQNHLLFRMPADRAGYEIDTGIASVGSVFGSPRALAPFFRFPGLFRTTEGEQHLRSRGLMSWSVDVDSYDWKKISVDQMLHHTLTDIEKRRGGILLMHDVQAKTALALPTLLAELKARGYRIVHVVPSGAGPVPDLVAGPPPQQQPRAQFPATAPIVREQTLREPIVREHVLREQISPYSRDTYSREPYQREPYLRNPNWREPNPRDPGGAVAQPRGIPPASPPQAFNPGGNGLFEAIFTSSEPRIGR